MRRRHITGENDVHCDLTGINRTVAEMETEIFKEIKNPECRIFVDKSLKIMY